MSRVLWLSTFNKDAYTDQTGMKHFGNVVHEVVTVEDTGRWDAPDTYDGKPVKDLGRVAKAADGRVFKSYPNTLDYWGGEYWLDERGRFWKEPPKNLEGWVDDAGLPMVLSLT